MIVRALSFYILRTLARHRRTSMFFAIWVPWGDAGFFALFASGRLSWLLLCWIWAPAGAVFVPPGWILCPLGLHFESFVSLWCEPEAPGARHREKFEKISKMKRLGSLIGSFLGHILSPLPPKIEPTSVLLRSFVSLFSRAFLAVFRRGFLDEIVESRRRPVCV
tara:strand:- start:153 stop:644 length:492 start_codon:yes stop_codon:yes gene_type:complete